MVFRRGRAIFSCYFCLTPPKHTYPPLQNTHMNARTHARTYARMHARTHTHPGDPLSFTMIVICNSAYLFRQNCTIEQAARLHDRTDLHYQGAWSYTTVFSVQCLLLTSGQDNFLFFFFVLFFSSSILHDPTPQQTDTRTYTFGHW